MNLLRPIFDIRLMWEDAPGWRGYKQGMERPSWSRNPFRAFLEEVFDLVDSSNNKLPDDCVEGDNRNSQYTAYEKAGGFATLLCVQAAKSLWLMLAYERQCWSVTCKPNKSNTIQRNELIKNAPNMKRTKFWALAFPDQATSCFNALEKSYSQQWQRSWRYPLRLSRELHDILYASFLKDSTNIIFPESYTAPSMSRAHQIGKQWLNRISRFSDEEKTLLLYWRRLPFAKAMDAAITGWGEEINDTDEWDIQIDDQSDSDEEDDAEEDIDSMKQEEETMEHWMQQFTILAQEELNQVYNFHFRSARKTSQTASTQSSANEQYGALYQRNKTSDSEGYYSNHDFIHIRRKKTFGGLNEMPLPTVPGVDFDEATYNLAMETAERKGLGIWGTLEYEMQCTGRTFCAGGPNDIIQPAGSYRRKVGKGWRPN
jgi:hypothetical protein